MATHDTIIVGASAGGVEALTKLVRGLAPELPAAVLIVLHVAPDYPSFLPTILSRDARLPVAHAVDGEEITTGRVYVAAPDHHLLIERQHLRLVHGPKERSDQFLNFIGMIADIVEVIPQVTRVRHRHST